MCGYKEHRMKRLIVATLLYCFASTGFANEQSCEWPTHQALASIVPIVSGTNSHASGVIVSDNLVITAAHALEDYSDTVAVVNGKLYVASVLLIDEEMDLALLSVWTDRLTPISLSEKDLHESQEVWAVGFPGAQEQHTTTGVFNFKKAEAVHTSAGIDSGASGGGLLSCEEGKFVLAGMLRGYGAYATDKGLVRLDDYSISVAARNIQFAINLSQNDL